MSSVQNLAPFRIEIRSQRDEETVPWLFFATASTEAQAAAAIERQNFASMEILTRIVPNEPLTGTVPVYETPPEARLLIAQLQSENLALRIESNRLSIAAEGLKKLAATAPKVDALVGESPLPFEVGQIVRDVYTGIAVKVTGLNVASPKTGNPRQGFTWQSLTKKPGDLDFEGWCPIGSVGCFRALRTDESTAAQAASLLS